MFRRPDRVTGSKTTETLARLAIRESKHVAQWMRGQGVKFQNSLGGTLSLSRTNPFFLGGGKALLNTSYLRAQALGVKVAYDAKITGLEMENGAFRAAIVRDRGFETRIEARALIAAASGFQANIDWPREA